MNAVMGYEAPNTFNMYPNHPTPCMKAVYRPSEMTRPTAVHMKHISPYKINTSDTHRHKRRYTSMGLTHDANDEYYLDETEQDDQNINNQQQETITSSQGAGMPLLRQATAPSLLQQNRQAVAEVQLRRCWSAPSTPFRPFRDEFRTDEYYRRYLQLSGNQAYKYPEPGYPRERQGAMGGTWRHIKEVGGYTGSQVCFVDGLVRLYDHDFKRQPSPSKQAPFMRATMATPAYAANRHNVTSYGKTLQTEFERSAYKPWDSSTQSQPQNCRQPSSGKYKGFYSYGTQ